MDSRPWDVANDTTTTTTSTGCEDEGCETDHGVCQEGENECDIQCGAEQYRHGDYCYHCSRIDGSTPCKECDGEGLCKACNAGYGLRNGECREMEQIGLDKIAERLSEAGRGGCTSPDLLTCRDVTCRGSSTCGTFSVGRESSSGRVRELFAQFVNNETEQSRFITDLSNNVLKSLPTEIGYLTHVTALHALFHT